MKRTAHGENDTISSYRAGFLTGFFCALLGLSIIGGAWWAGVTLGEKNKTEKLKDIELEIWKNHKAYEEEQFRDEAIMMNAYENENIEVEMGTPMSVEEITKRLKATEK